MSQLFLPSSDGYEILPLTAARYRLVAPRGTPRAESMTESESLTWFNTQLLRAPELPDASGPRWVLLASRATRVLLNGEPLALGVALLRHRDELRFPGGDPIYFSAERLTAVEPCPRDDAPRCPRCAQPIARGEPAVGCPGCGVLHHQLADRPCWTHLPRCARCAQITALDAGLRWSPEEP